MRVGGQASQDILEIRERRDAGQLAALREGVQQGGAPRAVEAASDQPVIATERDYAQLVLGARMPRPRICRVEHRTRSDVRDCDCAA